MEDSEYMQEVSTEPSKAVRPDASSPKKANVAAERRGEMQPGSKESVRPRPRKVGDGEMDLYEDEHDDVAQESSVESEAETVIEEVPKPHLSLVDDTNQLAPVKPTPELVRKVFEPEGYTQAEHFDELYLQAQDDVEDYAEMKLRM